MKMLMASEKKEEIKKVEEKGGKSRLYSLTPLSLGRVFLPSQDKKNLKKL